MKLLRRLLLCIFILASVPLVIMAQDGDEELEVPMPGNTASGDSITLDNGQTVPIPAQPPGQELIEYPGTSGTLLTEITEDEFPMPNATSGDSITLDNGQTVPIPAQSPTEELIEYPVTVTPAPIAQAPAQPIQLAHGYYRQVGSPTVSMEGQCLDPSVGAGGLCAANPEGVSEVHDFNNCWSSDPNSPNNTASAGLVPACQSADRESLFVSHQTVFYGRLSGNAYGRGSMDRQLLEQGGVSIGSFGILEGTQIEILSPTRFVMKYVHREQGGCKRVESVFYELADQSEAACQQVIEAPPEAQPQEPISTPPPLPPIEENKTYRVAIPVIPADCTAETSPPADFTDTQLVLDENQGVLTVKYASGTFITYQHFGTQFSYTDQRENVFRVDFMLFSDRIGFHWYKTDSSGAACAVDGELLPVDAPNAGANDSAAVEVVKDGPYQATWMPVEAICAPEALAALPTFTQATITAENDMFTVDYGTGSYPLTRQPGGDIYYYMATGDDGASVMVSLNSHTPEQFSLLYQYSDAAGHTCMANLDLTADNP